MYNYKNIFYSFSLDELEGFEEIRKATSELSYIPKDFKNEMVYDSFREERYAKLRSSLDSMPDKYKDLEREAKMHLNKVLPLLGKENTTLPSQKRWGLRPGHISFNNTFNRLGKLQSLMNNLFDFDCKIAGDFLYPPHGFRVWHTNKFDLESWFAFFVDVDKPDQSFFKFVDSETDKLITYWDKPKTVTIFRIDKSELFWHCIGTKDCNRWSQGFTIPNNWNKKIKL